MNKTCHVLRHCCIGEKWWDHSKPMTKSVLAGKETVLLFSIIFIYTAYIQKEINKTNLKKSCHGLKGPF